MSLLPRTGALLVSSLLFSALALAQDAALDAVAPAGHVPAEVQLDPDTGAIRIGDVQLAEAYATVEALQLDGANVEVAVHERVQQLGDAHRRVLEVTIETFEATADAPVDRAVLTFDATSLEAVMPGVQAEEIGGTPLYWVQSSSQYGPPAHANNGRSARGRATAAQARGLPPVYWAPPSVPVYWSAQAPPPVYWNAESISDTLLYWNAETEALAPAAAAALPVLAYGSAAE